MVQNSSAFSKQQLGQQLAQTLGQALSEPELSNCFKHIEILEPTAGKRFWQTADATVGIYIILAGKVRLLDSTDNLITSVGAGASFGELTLFPEEQFQPYAARASVKLRLCYVPGDVLRSAFGSSASLSLIRKYPSIRKHLHSSAVLQDSLLMGTNATQSTDNQRVTAFASKSEAVVFSQLPVERKPQSKISRAYFPNPTVFWQFFELVKPHQLVLLEVLIASILIQIFGLITPRFTQLLLDRVVVQRSNLTLTAVGLGLLIFGLFRVAITGLRQYLLDHTANQVDLALIIGFISHTFRLPLSFFESRYIKL